MKFITQCRVVRCFAFFWKASLCSNITKEQIIPTLRKLFIQFVLNKKNPSKLENKSFHRIYENWNGPHFKQKGQKNDENF